MDPFEELTISSRSGSQRDRVQASASPAAQQRLHDPFSQAPASGTVRGNPFLDHTGPASASSATRLTQPRGSAFGVRHAQLIVAVQCVQIHYQKHALT